MNYKQRDDELIRKQKEAQAKYSATNNNKNQSGYSLNALQKLASGNYRKVPELKSTQKTNTQTKQTTTTTPKAKVDDRNYVVKRDRYDKLMQDNRLANDIKTLAEVNYKNANQDATVSQEWADTIGAKNITGGYTKQQYLDTLSRRYSLTPKELNDMALTFHSDANKAETEAYGKGLEEAGKKLPVLGSLGSFVGTLGSGVEGAYNTLVGGITGDDRYLSNMFRTTKNSPREGVKQNIDSGLGQIAYDIGMGVGDMGVGAMAGSAPAILAGNTANEAQASAIDRGSSVRKSSAYAGAAGAIDYITNTIGLDKAKKLAVDGIKSTGLKKILLQGGAAGLGEAGENLIQDIGQSFFDNLINGKNSELITSYENKVASGMSGSDALKETAKEYAGQLAMSAGTGFAMGSAMQGGSTIAKNLPEIKSDLGQLNMDNRGMVDLDAMFGRKPELQDIVNRDPASFSESEITDLATRKKDTATLLKQKNAEIKAQQDAYANATKETRNAEYEKLAALKNEAEELKFEKKIYDYASKGKLLPAKDRLANDAYNAIYDTRTGLLADISYAQKFAGDSAEAKRLAKESRNLINKYVESGSLDDYEAALVKVGELDGLARANKKQYKTGTNTYDYDTYFFDVDSDAPGTLVDRAVSNSSLTRGVMAAHEGRPIYNTTSAPIQRSHKDLMPENPYFESDSYKTLSDNMKQTETEIDNLENTKAELTKLLEKEDLGAKAKSRETMTPDEYLDATVGDKVRNYTSEGTKIKQSLDNINKRLSELYTRRDEINASQRNLKKEASLSQRDNYIFSEPTAATQNEYQGFDMNKATHNDEVQDAINDGSVFYAEMSPLEYLQRSAYDIFNDSTLENTIRSANSYDQIAKFAEDMRNGDKFPIPSLTYDGKYGRGQEGRTRALAAYEAGLDKIPVAVVGKPSENPYNTRRVKETPSSISEADLDAAVAESVASSMDPAHQLAERYASAYRDFDPYADMDNMFDNDSFVESMANDIESGRDLTQYINSLKDMIDDAPDAETEAKMQGLVDELTDLNWDRAYTDGQLTPEEVAVLQDVVDGKYDIPENGHLPNSTKIPEYTMGEDVYFKGSDADIAQAEAQDQAIVDTFKNIIADPEFNALSFKNGSKEVFVSPATNGNGLRMSYTIDGVPTGHHDYSLDQLDDLARNLRNEAGNGGEDIKIQRKSDITKRTPSDVAMNEVPRLQMTQNESGRSSFFPPNNVPPSGTMPYVDGTMPGDKSKTSKTYTNTGKRGGGWNEAEYEKYTDESMFQYEPKEEQESFQEGYNMWQKEGREGFKNRVMDKERLTGAEIDGLMVEWRILAREARALEEAGQDASDAWKESIKVFRKIQTQSTENAQALQALAKWSRNTPEGMLSEAENIVNGKTKEKKSELQKELEKFGKRNRKFQFSEDFVKEFLKDAEEIMKYPADSPMANMLMAKLGRKVSRQIPVKFGEKLTSFLMDNMLGNFRTLISRNAGGNVGLNAVEQLAQRPLAAGIDALASKKTGKRTQAGLSKEGLAEYIQGFSKGLRDEARDVRTGLHTARTGENTLERAITANRHVFKEGGIMDKWDSLIKNGLSVGDRPFYEAVYKQTLGDYNRLRSAGLMGPDVQKLDNDQFKQYAETAAKMNALAAVYQGDTTLSKALLGFKRDIGNLSEGIVGVDILSQFSMPFVKTPANVVDVGISYSPLGIVRNAFRTGRELKNDNFDQNRFANEAARNILGTLGTAGAMGLAKNGILSGGYSDDADEKQAQKEAGEQEYALSLGDKQIDIGWLPVVGSNAVAAAATQDAIEKGEGGLAQNAMEGLYAGGKAMFDQSMFQGLQRLFGTGEAYDSDTGIAGNMVNVIKAGIGQGIPSLARQAGQVIDPYQRDMGYSNEDWEFGPFDNYDINSLVNNVPFLRQNILAPKVNTSGELIKENQGRNVGMKVLEDMILPGKITKVEYSDLANEAMRLQGETNSPDAYLPKATRKNVDTEDYHLTNDEWVDYQQKYYKALTAVGTMIMQSDTYKNADAETQTQTLKSAYDAVKSAINSEYNGKEIKGASKIYVEAGGGEKGADAVANYLISKRALDDAGISSSTNAAKEITALYSEGKFEEGQKKTEQAVKDNEARVKYNEEHGTDIKLADWQKNKGKETTTTTPKVTTTQNTSKETTKSEPATTNTTVDTTGYENQVERAGKQKARFTNDLPKLKELGYEKPEMYTYAYAINQDTSLTPQSFNAQFKKMDLDNGGSMSQDEMIEYFNRNNTSEKQANYLWRTYGEYKGSPWKAVPVLKNGTWKKKK